MTTASVKAPSAWEEAYSYAFAIGLIVVPRFLCSSRSVSLSSLMESVQAYSTGSKDTQHTTKLILHDRFKTCYLKTNTSKVWQHALKVGLVVDDTRLSYFDLLRQNYESLVKSWIFDFAGGE